MNFVWGRRARVMWNQSMGESPGDYRVMRARIEPSGVTVQFCSDNGAPFCERWYPNTSICFVEWEEQEADAVHASCSFGTKPGKDVRPISQDPRGRPVGTIG